MLVLCSSVLHLRVRCVTVVVWTVLALLTCVLVLIVFVVEGFGRQMGLTARWEDGEQGDSAEVCGLTGFVSGPVSIMLLLRLLNYLVICVSDLRLLTGALCWLCRVQARIVRFVLWSFRGGVR